MKGKPQAELKDDQEYELYDLLEDPYELRNLARDQAYKPLLDDMLVRLRELEDEHFSPVEVPAYGGPSLVEVIRPRPARAPGHGAGAARARHDRRERRARRLRPAARVRTRTSSTPSTRAVPDAHR